MARDMPAVDACAEAVVMHTADEGQLAEVCHPSVQAVIFTPTLPDWFAELRDVVRTRRFEVPRTVLPAATRAEIAEWLDDAVPRGAAREHLRVALRDDVTKLVDRVAALTGSARFRMRVFTAAPTADCGFHVDSVPPGAPTVGLLRVYNGAGTAYVCPADVRGIREFYHYLARRERLERERAAARSARLLDVVADVERQIACLDAAPEFLADPGAIRIAPAGSIVAFKHLDAALFWSDHDKRLAWIHCSPMDGEPRLVVNVTAADSAVHIPRRV